MKKLLILCLVISVLACLLASCTPEQEKNHKIERNGSAETVTFVPMTNEGDVKENATRPADTGIIDGGADTDTRWGELHPVN